MTPKTFCKLPVYSCTPSQLHLSQLHTLTAAPLTAHSCTSHSCTYHSCIPSQLHPLTAAPPHRCTASWLHPLTAAQPHSCTASLLHPFLNYSTSGEEMSTWYRSPHKTESVAKPGTVATQHTAARVTTWQAHTRTLRVLEAVAEGGQLSGWLPSDTETCALTQVLGYQWVHIILPVSPLVRDHCLRYQAALPNN